MKTILRSPCRHILTSLLIPAALHLVPCPASAGTIWDGGGSDDNWGTGANWDDDLPPLTGNTVDLTFAGTTRLTPVNNYAAFDDFRSIFFDATAGAFSLSGSAIDLFGKIENYSTATQTLAMDLAINAGQPGTGEFNPINGDLVINSANVFGNGNTLHVYGVNGKTVTFGAGTVISDGLGTTHFNVEQASNAVFLGANTYTGTTNVLAGSLTIGGGGTTGAHGTGTVTVLAGAKLNYNRSDDITIANVLAGAGDYVKAGAGVLSLTGANTLSGTLTISNGTVNVGANAGALGTASVVLGDAATGAGNVALLTTTANVARPITVSALGTGTATIGSTTGAGSGNRVFSGLLTLNRPTTLTAASTDRTSYTGKITGNVGTLTFAGGQRTVLENTTSDFVGNIVVTGTNTVMQTGVANGSEHIPNGSSIDIGAGAFVKLAGAGGSVETINALSGSGTMRRHEGVSGTQTLVLGSAGGGSSFSGALQNGAGALALRKEGAATQTFVVTAATSNTASGGVTVNGGTLAFTGVRGFNAGALPQQTWTVNTGATLEFNGDWLTRSTSTYVVNGGTVAFTKNTGPANQIAINYVNNLTLNDGTITGPAGFRTGNLEAGVTFNVTGDAGSNISSIFELIKNSATQTITLNVADGAADADLTVSGVIRDDAALSGSTLAKTGAGKFVMTGANTYNGTTLITAGTLQVGNGGTSGTLGTGPVTNDAALFFNRSNDISVANEISGTGSVMQTGPGTTTLTGANTYTGTTAVSAGTLLVTHAQTGGGDVTVADGAAFGVQIVEAGTTFNAATLTSGSATGATLRFDTGALGNPTAAPLSATTFTPAAATTLRVTGTNLTPGTFTLLDYTGAIGGLGYGGLALALPFRVGGSLVNNSGNSSVDVNITVAETIKWQGNVNSDWDIDPNGGNSAGTFNWRTTVLNTATRYAQGPVNTDTVTFDDSANAAATTVNLTTTLAPSALTVNNSALNYSFAGTGKLSGTTGLLKQGSGTLTLGNSGANDFSGTITIENGTVSVASLNDSGTAGTLGAGTAPIVLGATGTTGTLRYTDSAAAGTNRAFTLASDGTGALRVDDANANVTLTGVIGGIGALLKTGAGQLTLSAANSYAAGTTISAGRLEGTTNGAFGFGPIIIGDTADDASLFLGNRADIPNPVTVSGLGTGLVILGGSNTGSGANAASFLSVVTLERATTFISEVAGDRLTFDGQISGNVGLLTIAGGSRTTLTNAANDFVGDILVTGATTVFQSGVGTAISETIPDGSSVTVDAGAAFQLAATTGTETINALNGSGTVRGYPGAALGPSLTIGSAGGSGSFSGGIENSLAPLAITKVGAGTQTLTGVSSFSGGVSIEGGTLEVNSDAALGASTGPVAINNNAELQAIGPVTTAARTITLGAAGGSIDTNGNTVILDVGSTVTGATLTKLGAGKLVIAGTQTYDALETMAGSTDVTSTLGTGTSSIIANAETNISASQTLASLTIGPGAVVTFGALPPAPGEAGGAAPMHAVPEPGAALSLFSGLGLLLGLRRRRR